MYKETTALVSMEILVGGLRNYAGGLGILAGDMLSTARDLNYDLTGFTLLYDKGYVKNSIENGEIKSYEDGFDPEEFFVKVKKKFFIELKDIKIWFRVWKYELSDDARVFYIDSDVNENLSEHRELTKRVYIDTSPEHGLLKRMLLGLGTLKIINELGLKINKYHLNETHSVFLAIELFKSLPLEHLRKTLVFTTHTPLPHGHEKHGYELVERFYDVPEEIRKISPDMLHTTKILLHLSGYSNAVSHKHWIITKRMFPDAEIDFITNGVHSKWVNPSLRVLYDKYLPGWFHYPEKFSYAGIIPLEELKDAKEVVKKRLINKINESTYHNKDFNKEDFILVLRRRITGYKRNDIVFRNVERIEEISKKYKIGVVVSGTLQPYDNGGKAILKNLIDIMGSLYHTKLSILLENGKEAERISVGGGDLFLHTPIPPYEACGTSWIRASLNAIPVLTSMDGGTLEGIVHNYNGWFFGKNYFSEEEYNEEEDLRDFYAKLEDIIRLARENEREFLMIGRNALKTIAPSFSMKRCLQEYIWKAYRK